MIDIHSHILPGVDDGARDLDESIEILKWLTMQGVSQVVLTPHYIVDTDYSSPKNINELLLKELESRVESEGLNIKLSLGNEIYIDKKIIGLIQDGTIATMAGGGYLLVELPMNDEYPNYADYLKELINAGYRVILAHPERYSIIQKNYRKIRELVDIGVLFQCNLKSILGVYGKKAERVIKKIAKDKLIFALASDTHRVGRGDYLKAAKKRLKKYYDERELNMLLSVNPEKIIDNTL